MVRGRSGATASARRSKRARSSIRFDERETEFQEQKRSRIGVWEREGKSSFRAESRIPGKVPQRLRDGIPRLSLGMTILTHFHFNRQTMADHVGAAVGMAFHWLDSTA
jgi:hypothetical protein